MNRLQRLQELKKHPFLGKHFLKLTDSDDTFILEFISDNFDVESSVFASRVNRMFLYSEKPKNHNLIWTILTELISSEILEQRHNKK